MPAQLPALTISPINTLFLLSPSLVVRTIASSVTEYDPNNFVLITTSQLHNQQQKILKPLSKTKVLSHWVMLSSKIILQCSFIVLKSENF